MHKLYETIARQLADRIPGVRKLSEQFGVSISIVVQVSIIIGTVGKYFPPRKNTYTKQKFWLNLMALSLTWLNL